MRPPPTAFGMPGMPIPHRRRALPTSWFHLVPDPRQGLTAPDMSMLTCERIGVGLNRANRMPPISETVSALSRRCTDCSDMRD